MKLTSAKLNFTLAITIIVAFGYFTWDVFGSTIINKLIRTNIDLERGLVGHWTFDGKDMNPNARDRSGQGNHGNLTGFTSTTTAPGKIGQALDFDGNDNYVTMADSAVFDFGTGDFSISGWFNHSSVLPGAGTASTDTTTIVSPTDEGRSSLEAGWAHQIFHDPNNDRWHRIYIDSGADIHTQSTADTSGTSWTDGIDIETDGHDYEDFSCVSETDGATTYLHCVYAEGTDQNIFYKRCTLSGTTPFITCDSKQIVVDENHVNVTTADEFANPHVTVDFNDCLLISAELQDVSLTEADRYQVWLFKEASPCGNGSILDHLHTIDKESNVCSAVFDSPKIVPLRICVACSSTGRVIRIPSGIIINSEADIAAIIHIGFVTRFIMASQ